MESSHLQASHHCSEVRVDLSQYSELVLDKAAHVFTGKYYVEIHKGTPTTALVRFTQKPNSSNGINVADEFRNELIDQKLRLILAEKTETVRNLILAHALSGTDILHPHLEQADPQTDPDRIGAY